MKGDGETEANDNCPQGLISVSVFRWQKRERPVR